MALAGCGHGDRFEVTGSIAGDPSMNLRILYYTDSKVFTGVTAATEGKFAFDGRAPEEALVTIYDNDYRLLGRFMAANGQDITIGIDPANPASLTVQGNKTSERWTKFLADNAAVKGTARDKAVADYVKANPADPLSTLLVMTEIDATGPGASLADSLLTIIEPEARLNSITAGFQAMLDHVNSATSRTPIAAIPYMIPGGYVKLYTPHRAGHTLITITDIEHERDSVKKLLRELRPETKASRLSVLDLSVDVDTIVWSRQLRADSIDWTAGWAAGGVSGRALNSLGIPRLPYYIVADSAGRQIWRSHSTDDTRRFVKKLTD